jgi:hypothetical protein
MNQNKRTARIAGLLYLIVAMSGAFHLLYVPSRLIVAGNSITTVNNIVDSETLFRLSILSGLICYTAFLLLPLVLYRLLSSVNKTHAVLMVTFAVVSVPVSFINLLNKFAVLTLIAGSAKANIPGNADLQAQIMLHLDYYGNGIQLVSIFWGLWLLPFGYLVFKSGFLPKILGVLLIAGCFGYLINFTVDFLFPQYSNSTILSFVTALGGIGEIGTCLWLLILGIKDKSYPPYTESTAAIK